MNLPVPWLGAPPYCAASDYQQIVAFMKDAPDAAANPELLEVLGRAAARADADSGAHGVPVHIRCAQAMLEMAVEWRLPDVERWATAWLMAAGGGQLRIRWSSRSRDGRFRREARASAPIVSIAEAGGRVLLGLKTGKVESWADDGTMRSLLTLTDSPVWAIAAQLGKFMAVGVRNACETRGWPAPPSIPPPLAGLRAAAIGPGGRVAVGTNAGYLRTWTPGRREWDMSTFGSTEPVAAIAYAHQQPELIRVVWESGELAELDQASETWRLLHTFPARVRAAAWAKAGTMLAVAAGSEVWLVAPGAGETTAARLLWNQDGVVAVAWSPDDVLAVASRDLICASTGRVRSSSEVAYKSIATDELVEKIALPDSGHVVSVEGNHLVLWELGNAGSDDPTFFAGDRITALGIQPGDRRVTLAGTVRGRLREYSAAGAIVRDARLPGEPKVTQIGWDGAARSWLVASLDGMYRYRPGEDPELVAEAFLQSAAIGGGRFAYAAGNLVTTSDAGSFALPGPVTDLHADPRGTFVALDQEGHIRVQRPGREAVAGPGQGRGSRLLGNDEESLLVQEFDGRIRLVLPHDSSRSFGRLPADLLAAVPFDKKRIVVAYEDEGILLARAGKDSRSWVPDRVRVMTVNSGRIAVGTPNHVAGYDVLDAGGEATDGSIRLSVESVRSRSQTTSGYQIRLPGGEPIKLTGTEVMRAATAMMGGRDDRPATVRDLSEAVYQAGRIGDLLWQGGLDLVIDRARGPDPNRPVRLEWHCQADDRRVERFPWELLHPSTAPLGWFDSPEITSVRLVTPAGPAPDHQGFASGASPTMLVVRGTAAGMKAVDDAFDRFRRRSRRTDLTLVTKQPIAVSDAKDLAGALGRPADIVQLWMHSGEGGIRLTDSPEQLATATVASLLREQPPRLVILVGCRSGTLGRALVERGVLAVVAMRVPVFDHTVQPLVEDFTALALNGTPVDLAFARALRRYLLTGQPGAAAVPMLYLAENAGRTLFPRH
jgi:sulfur carrier protein ThiS